MSDSYAPRIGTQLSAKIIAGFLLLTFPALAAMVASGLYALWNLNSVNQELQEISRSLEAVQGLDTAVARSVTPLSAYLVDGASGQDRRFEAAIREVESRMKGCSSSPCHGTSRQPGAMAESLAPYVQGIKDRAAIVFGGADSPAEQIKVRVLHEINQQSEEANQRLERMASSLLARVSSLENKSQEVSRRAETLILLTAAVVLALAAVSAWLLSRRLLKHVGALLTGTRKIMEGDLGYRVAIAQTDEIGELARSFNAMAQEIQEHRQGLERIVEARTAELRQAQASLLQSEKLASIGLLASGVAHELNNPLTSILMNVKLLVEDVGDQPALRAELERIGEDTVRCKRIIDDLRDFSRRHDLDLAHTDLNKLACTALDLLARRTDMQAITVKCELAREMRPVSSDPARMEQVLTNVLSNAVQAMPKGGMLTVGTALEGGFAEISVHDTGEGIAEDIRSRIFDPFFTTKPQGTGLGLSIVYRIMEAHGGRVKVETTTSEASQPNASHPSGTRIRLLLPLATPSADKAPEERG